MADSPLQAGPATRSGSPISIIAAMRWLLVQVFNRPRLRHLLVFSASLLIVVATAWWRLPAPMGMFAVLTLLLGSSTRRRNVD